jgi:hypothetical protein
LRGGGPVQSAEDADFFGDVGGRAVRTGLFDLAPREVQELEVLLTTAAKILEQRHIDILTAETGRF